MSGGGKGGGGKSIVPTDFSMAIQGGDSPIAMDMDVVADVTANANINMDVDADMNLQHDGTVNMNTSMTGDKNAPIAMMVLGDEAQPVSMNMTTDNTMNMSASMKGAKDEPISMMMLGDQQQPISAFIAGDKDRPVALSMELQNLPRMTVEDLKDLTTPEIKITIPGQHNVCFKVLGQELFSFCYGGEQQIITEPFTGSTTDMCNVPACDVDTRAFPERPKG